MSYPALDRLQESLDATAVLSDRYKGDVLGWAYRAVSEAYDAGRASALEQFDTPTGRSFDKLTPAEKEAMREAAALTDNQLGISERSVVPAAAHRRAGAHSLVRARRLEGRP